MIPIAALANSADCKASTPSVGIAAARAPVDKVTWRTSSGIPTNFRSSGTNARKNPSEILPAIPVTP